MASAKENWMSFYCLVADADKEILSQCPKLDRMTVGGEAVMLLLVGTLAVVVWLMFFASFSSVTTALPAGLLVGFMIFMLDRKMGSSDWTLAGVLSTGGWPRPQWWGKLLVRVVAAFMFASVTATGLTMALYRDTLTEQLRLEQTERNSGTQQKYDKLKEEAHAVIVGPHKQEYDSLIAQEKDIRAALQEQRELHADAESRAAASRIERGREEIGGMAGYDKGRGPLYHEAQRQLDEALLVASTSDREVARLNEQLKALSVRTQATVAALQRANAALVKEQQRLDRQMKEDSRWHAQKNGPLSRWMAFDHLRRDEDQGAAVAKFDFKAKMTLIALELSFLALKMLFSSASEYHVRLTRRARERAAREIHDLRKVLRTLRGPAVPGRPRTMRLVTTEPGS